MPAQTRQDMIPERPGQASRLPVPRGRLHRDRANLRFWGALHLRGGTQATWGWSPARLALLSKPRPVLSQNQMHLVNSPRGPCSDSTDSTMITGALAGFDCDSQMGPDGSISPWTGTSRGKHTARGASEGAGVRASSVSLAQPPQYFSLKAVGPRDALEVPHGSGRLPTVTSQTSLRSFLTQTACPL